MKPEPTPPVAGAPECDAALLAPAPDGLQAIAAALAIPFQGASFPVLVERLEAAMRQVPNCSAGPDPIHHFARGVYARELRIPADMLILGKVHRHSQINMVLAGEISVFSEEGVRLCKAGDVIVSPPGVQRVGYAHTDTTWVTVHGTHETDLERLEAELIVPAPITHQLVQET